MTPQPSDPNTGMTPSEAKMTVKEVKEIVKIWTGQQKSNRVFTMDLVVRSMGFLEGRASLQPVLKEIMEYCLHTNRCILSFWECGEQTEDGGYRSKYAGKWYRTKPECNCGLSEVYDRAEKELGGE